MIIQCQNLLMSFTSNTGQTFIILTIFSISEWWLISLYFWPFYRDISINLATSVARIGSGVGSNYPRSNQPKIAHSKYSLKFFMPIFWFYTVLLIFEKNWSPGIRICSKENKFSTQTWAPKLNKCVSWQSWTQYPRIIYQREFSTKIQGQ